MSKTQHVIKLVGITDEGEVASIQQAGDVEYFNDPEGKVSIFQINEKTDEWLMQTSKGEYSLVKHPNSNIYTGNHEDIKFHFTKKKLVGQLIYWA